MTTYSFTTARIEDVKQTGDKIAALVGGVLSGKSDQIHLALTVLLAEGHLLIEDVPGVGKTSLAKALTACIDGSIRRIQFTPDLMPGDVTGVSVYNQHTQDFEFKPGAVFANIVIGDEINRAAPRAQSALLECMEERNVTIDGTSYRLPAPFMVIATQNPIEMEGTYPLPEAELDRFMARIEMGYPNVGAELAMLDHHLGDNVTDGHGLIQDITPVCTAATISTLTSAVRGVFIADSIKEYVIALVGATRAHPDVKVGASPRAALHLLRTARAKAALAGRDFVLPDDIQELATLVLAHRIVTNTAPANAVSTASALISALLSRVPVPTATSRQTPRS